MIFAYYIAKKVPYDTGVNYQ